MHLLHTFQFFHLLEDVSTIMCLKAVIVCLLQDQSSVLQVKALWTFQRQRHLQTSCVLTLFCKLYGSLCFFPDSAHLCIPVCRVHDDTEGPAQHLQQRPAGMKVCLCVHSRHGKDFPLSCLSWCFCSLSSFFRRIRRPCLTAMTQLTLCYRWQLESCQLLRSE